MTKEQIEEITKKSGLVCMGIDEAGDIQWMGDTENWQKGEPLIYKANLKG